MKNAYKLQNTKRRKWSRNGTCRLTREKCSMSCSKTSTCAVHTYFLDTIIRVSMYILEDLIPSSAKDNIRISHTHTILSGSCFFFYYLHFTTCILFPIMVASFFSPFFFFFFALPIMPFTFCFFLFPNDSQRKVQSNAFEILL